MSSDLELLAVNAIELYCARTRIEIYQPCCLRKSVYKKLLNFIHGLLLYPDTLSTPLLAKWL